MRTNIDIDDDLLRKAMAITGQKTKKQAVEEALKQLVKSHARREALEAMRGLGWEGNLDEMREGRDFGDLK